ncbi:MAG TPA: thioesterase family protein [Solirubrobacteraceae bacterium]|jgi:acyl-CoA thioester hydrolase|nr:thioesterase family protein [Solirubrobacteraceae bacterium]
MAEPFRHRFRVRYAECDAQSVVFNAHYFAYFDLALTELFRAVFGGYESMLERQVDLVVGEASARFLAPARFDDELEVAVSVTRLGTTGVTTRYELLRDGQLLVEGTLRHVVVNLGTHAKAPIPDWMREGLEAFAG